jgi:hypothetical protein
MLPVPASEPPYRRLLLELGALALLVLAIAAAIFLIRYRAWRFVGVPPEADGHPPSRRDRRAEKSGRADRSEM